MTEHSEEVQRIEKQDSPKKLDKGKGKLVQPDPVLEHSEDEAEEDFDPSNDETPDSESDLEAESEEEEDSEASVEEDEIAGLLQEAEEYGDKGDMVYGLRSGRHRRDVHNVNADLTKQSASSSSVPTKRPANSEPDSPKKNPKKKHVRSRSASSPVKVSLVSEKIAPAADSFHTALSSEDIQDKFLVGLDKWGGIFKNAIVVSPTHFQSQSLKSEFVNAKKELAYCASQSQKQERLQLERQIQELQEQLASKETQYSQLSHQMENRDVLLETLMQYLSDQRVQTTLSSTYSRWKSKSHSAYQEKLAAHMANIHYHATVMRKVMGGWRQAVGTTWRIATEKKIKKEAEKCMQDMSRDYEVKIESLNKTILDLSTKLEQVEKTKEWQQEEMKKALMRGVCALNLEAMSLFKDSNLTKSTIGNWSGSHPKVENPETDSLEKSEPSYQEAFLVPSTQIPKVALNPSQVEKQNEKQVKKQPSRVLVTRHI